MRGKKISVYSFHVYEPLVPLQPLDDRKTLCLCANKRFRNPNEYEYQSLCYYQLFYKGMTSHDDSNQLNHYQSEMTADFRYEHPIRQLKETSNYPPVITFFIGGVFDLHARLIHNSKTVGETNRFISF